MCLTVSMLPRHPCHSGRVFTAAQPFAACSALSLGTHILTAFLQSLHRHNTELPPSATSACCNTLLRYTHATDTAGASLTHGCAQVEFADMYTERNVAISGIHTHSGPGGYLQYVLYDITSLGFVEQSWEAVVSGIVEVGHLNLPQLVQHNPNNTGRVM